MFEKFFVEFENSRESLRKQSEEIKGAWRPKKRPEDILRLNRTKKVMREFVIGKRFGWNHNHIVDAAEMCGINACDAHSYFDTHRNFIKFVREYAVTDRNLPYLRKLVEKFIKYIIRYSDIYFLGDHYYLDYLYLTLKEEKVVIEHNSMYEYFTKFFRGAGKCQNPAGELKSWKQY